MRSLQDNLIDKIFALHKWESDNGEETERQADSDDGKGSKCPHGPGKGSNRRRQSAR